MLILFFLTICSHRCEQLCDSERTDLKKKERFQGLKLYNINIPTCQMPVLNGTNRRFLKIRMDITNALWFSK
jgi:hypothetical protein